MDSEENSKENPNSKNLVQIRKRKSNYKLIQTNLTFLEPNQKEPEKENIIKELDTTRAYEEFTTIEKQKSTENTRLPSKILTKNWDSLSIDEQQTVTYIDPKVFEEMRTNTEITISELNNQGWKVLLFFSSAVGCIHCQGTMEDIYEISNELLKLNTIPVIVHEESIENYNKFINSNSSTKKYSIFMHLNRFEFVHHFKLTKEHTLSKIWSYAQSGFPEFNRLKKIGLKVINSLPKDNRQLAACFVVQNSKIISEYRKEHKYQRFDVARIVLDPDGFGIEIRTTNFQCNIPSVDTFQKKGQIKLKDILNDGNNLLYFKLHATTEFSSENIIFFEEVTKIQNLSNEELTIESKRIYDDFLVQNSKYRLNTSKKLIQNIEIRIQNKEWSVHLFDEILQELESEVFIDMYSRFSKSELYQQMCDEKKKKTNYLIYK
jgi:hypothetical protein